MGTDNFPEADGFRNAPWPSVRVEILFNLSSLDVGLEASEPVLTSASEMPGLPVKRRACNLVTKASVLDDVHITFSVSRQRKWGLCALRHDIQNSMEAILACHPAQSTK